MRIGRTKAAQIARGLIERTFNVRVFRNDVRMFVTPGHFRNHDGSVAKCHDRNIVALPVFDCVVVKASA
jgi:hypothetical protein